MAPETTSRAGKKSDQTQGDLFAVPEAQVQPVAPARKRAKTPARQVAKKRGRKPKPRELKMVRESLTLPLAEQKALSDLQLALRKRGRYEVTRSLILRAGIARLAQLPAAELLRALDAVEKAATKA